MTSGDPAVEPDRLTVRPAAARGLRATDPKGTDINTTPTTEPVRRDLTTTPHLDATISVWSQAILTTLRAIYMRRLRDVMDADDAAQDYMVIFHERAEALMAAYPSPEDLARAVSLNHLYTWQRRQRTQAGQGARLVENADGTRRPGRERVSFDSFLGTYLEACDDVEHQVVGSGYIITEVRAALDQIGTEDGDLLTEIWLNEHSRAEVADQLRCTAPALRQREKRARDRLRPHLEHLRVSQ